MLLILGVSRLFSLSVLRGCSIYPTDEKRSQMVIEMFLARTDVNVDSKDRNGRTPLSFAAEQGHVSAVKLLLARNDIDADSKDDDGRTPLSFAVEVQSHCLFDLSRIVTQKDTKW
jgi:ankyrin repeat protein